MTLNQAMAALKKAGTAQNRKIYGNHGVDGDMFGVSYAEMGKLAKSIKTDHELALELWDTGNHDARILATMVADPVRLTSRQLDAMVRDQSNYVLTDGFSVMVLRSGQGHKKFESWKNRRNEWTSATAWNLLGGLANHEDDTPDKFFADQLTVITKEIHQRPNRVRHSMNQAVICIGTRNPALTKKAKAAAKKIGKVEVDHGKTSCKTPEAIAYIDKVLDYRTKKAAG